MLIYDEDDYVNSRKQHSKLEHSTVQRSAVQRN